MRRPALALTFLALAATPALAQQQPAPAPLIAQGCAGCHGQAGAGVGGTPAIAGTDRAAFLATWAAFRANERPATIMNRIARSYSDAEVATLADYFSSVK